MKIVINRCWGGFGISKDATLELIKMKSPIIEKMTLKEYHGGNNANFKDTWKESLKDTKKYLSPFKEGFLQHEYIGGLFTDKFVYHLIYDRKVRSHKDLISVVEKLKDKANGDLAKLKIVEIPDGTDYEIDEYDGMESVEETHRTWN